MRDLCSPNSMSEKTFFSLLYTDIVYLVRGTDIVERQEMEFGVSLGAEPKTRSCGQGVGLGDDSTRSQEEGEAE